MKKKRLLLFFTLAVFAFAGCGGNPVREKVEKTVQKNLPDMVGPAKSYTVRAYGPTMHMVNGRLDGMDITGIDVHLPSGITLAKLDVKIRDIAYNIHKSKLERAANTEFSATLSEYELNRYLVKNYPAIPGLKVSLKNGEIGIESAAGISAFKVGANAGADLEVRENRILALNFKKLKFAGLNAPEFAKNFLSSKLDTIFDAKDIGPGATLSSTSIENGKLVLNGTLDLVKMSEQKK